MPGRFDGNRVAYASYRPRKHAQKPERPETRWMLTAAVIAGVAFVVMDITGVF